MEASWQPESKIIAKPQPRNVLGDGKAFVVGASGEFCDQPEGITIVTTKEHVERIALAILEQLKTDGAALSDRAEFKLFFGGQVK